MDPITHTVLAVGSLVGFFLAGEWIGRKKKADEEGRESLANVIGLKSVKREIHYFLDFL